ncbi:MAG: hypothetical protein ACI3WS_05390 [Phascolarctobacterium sp.]
MVKNSMVPCLDCAERHVGCHGRCEKYQSWNKEHQEYLKVKRQQEAIDIYNAGKAVESKFRNMRFTQAMSCINSALRGGRK